MKPYVFIIIVSCLLLACTKEAAPNAHHHAHVHSAPHGGTLVEIGAHQANVELLCDRSMGTLSVYILGPHAERPVRIKAEQINIVIDVNDVQHTLVLQAQASALSGEEVGDSATFAVTDAHLKTDARINVTIPELILFDQRFENISGILK